MVLHRGAADALVDVRFEPPSDDVVKRREPLQNRTTAL